jgi:hypothetical protein
MKQAKTLEQLFSFPGFRAKQRLSGIFGDSGARVVELARRKRGHFALAVASAISRSMIEGRRKCETNQSWAGASMCALRGAA